MSDGWDTAPSGEGGGPGSWVRKLLLVIVIVLVIFVILNLFGVVE